MVNLPKDMQDIDKWVEEHPVRYHPPAKSLYKTVTTAVKTEKLPIPSLDDLGNCTFKLADFSHGTWGLPTTSCIFMFTPMQDRFLMNKQRTTSRLLCCGLLRYIWADLGMKKLISGRLDVW